MSTLKKSRTRSRILSDEAERMAEMSASSDVKRTSMSVKYDIPQDRGV